MTVEISIKTSLLVKQQLELLTSYLKDAVCFQQPVMDWIERLKENAVDSRTKLPVTLNVEKAGDATTDKPVLRKGDVLRRTKRSKVIEALCY